ncbi:Bifunctional purine biosynthesis protein PurH [Linderina macrospora]|uniref:Bifunctional purine biosynthesis protein PurH n=1 Tax=Linderina macrospora TaxID=4868 RepID=A0ACC1J1A1_9FUNG|nr:Bifunctional purine biosynthesis protein PurH [Linderina macrospora]
MLQFAVEIGIFLSQFIAIFLVRVPGWRILFGLSGGISLIQVLLLPMLPESPKFLISHGRLTEAEQALRFLRPNYDITNEFNDMLLAGNPSHVPRTDFVPVEGQSTTSVNKARITSAVMPKINVNASPELSMVAGSGYATKTVGIMDILRGRTPDVISHMVFCTLFLTGFQQWTGAKGIVFYSTEILAKVFKLNHAQLAKIPNKPQKMTIGISVTGILAVFISMLLMDRLGRRRLLLLSTGGLTVSCLLIFIGEIASADILAVLAMFVYKIMYGLGMAPIPWLAASEMVPYYALGTLSGVASALNWTMIFAIGMTFPHMAHALQDYLFLPFAVLNLAAFAVVLLFMPETKGKSIADILRDHGRPIHFVLKFPWARRTNTDSAASAQPYTA